MTGGWRGRGGEEFPGGAHARGADDEGQVCVLPVPGKCAPVGGVAAGFFSLGGTVVDWWLV